MTSSPPSPPSRLRLNLGCGQNPREGFLNVDKFPACNPDMVCDLEVFPWPFEDNSAELIILHHVLEHLGETTDKFFAVMKELYRISAPDARIEVTVPHPRSHAFLNDPTHVRAISPAIMLLFSKDKNHEWRRLGWPNTALGLYLDIDFATEKAEHRLLPKWQRKLDTGEMTHDQIIDAIDNLNNVAEEIVIVLRAVK